MSIEIQEMFSRIAPRYDLANDVLSMGIHRRWRKQAIAFAGVKRGESAVDICSGTGDFAFALADAVGPGGFVQGIDFVPEMISLAQEKHSKCLRARSSTSGS